MVRRALLFTLLAGATAGACASFTSETAQTVSDAGADAAGDGSWTPCAERPQSPAHFCVDFDDLGFDVTAGWTTRYLHDGGVLEPSTEAKTPPRALRVATPASDAAEQAELVERFDNVDAAQATRVAVDFDFEVSRPFALLDGGSGFADLAVIDFGTPECATLANGDKQRSIELLFLGKGTFTVALKGLQGCGIANDYVPSETARTMESFMDGFHHAHVELAKKPCPNDASQASVTVAFDGTIVSCTRVNIDAFAAAKPLSLLLGTYVGRDGVAHSDVAFVYDDVTVDIE